MELIHIVANVESINMGVWNACLRCEQDLLKANIFSHFWTCSSHELDTSSRFKLLDLSETRPKEFIEGLELHFNKTETILITHGAWLEPTRIGFYGSKAGFKWIYVPQGMLEPWSMKQNFFFKTIYFKLFEERYLRKATTIRAVSRGENKRLASRLNANIFYVPNSVPEGKNIVKKIEPIQITFMGRLHLKKGILPLVMAWNQVFNSNTQFQLKVAGPDEGELEKIKPYLSVNIQYLGAVYGMEKQKLLSDSHYYILPSFSEGLPSSVLEGMSFGAIPLISKGCNFEEIFEENLGFQAEPEIKKLVDLLKKLKHMVYDQNKSNANVEWINNHYKEEAVAKLLIKEYQNILNYV